MCSHLSDGKFDRVRYIETINATVLKMIHNKKYPSSQEKFNLIRKKTLQCQLIKNKTSQPATHQQRPIPRNHSTRAGLQSICFRSIGDHLHSQNLRHELNPMRVSQQVLTLSNQMNQAFWERKKEVALKDSSTERSTEYDQQPKFREMKSELKRSSFEELPLILRNLRRQLSCESIQDDDQEISFRKNDFLSTGLKNKIEKYPLERCEDQNRTEYKVVRRDHHKMTKMGNNQDNAVLKREMIEELKENKPSDKFCRMRMAINHKKIVSLG